MTTDVEASEHASTLQTLAKLRRTQQIGKWAEGQAKGAAEMVAHSKVPEWWDGYSVGLTDLVSFCLSMMPNGEWLPEDGDKP